MTKLSIAFMFALILTISTHVAFSQSDAITSTLPVAIDGITRTVTISFVPTGVLSVAVAPVSDEFDSRARMWLDGFWMVAGELQPNADVDIESVNSRFDTFLDATETVRYPVRYTPFVRQYRFAIHTCRNLVWFHDLLSDEENGFDMFSIGTYTTLSTACYEQYQDAYVELERIVYNYLHVTTIVATATIPTLPTQPPVAIVTRTPTSAALTINSQEPTSTPQPTFTSTTTSTPFPTSTPTTVSSSGNGYSSGGLGLSQFDWDKNHTKTELDYQPIGTGYDYKYDVMFQVGNVWIISRGWSTGEFAPLDVVEAESQTLIPADSQFIETYSPEERPETIVNLYFSESLKSRFRNEDSFSGNWWTGGEPGNFTVQYNVYDGKVGRMSIGIGNNH